MKGLPCTPCDPVGCVAIIPATKLKTLSNGPWDKDYEPADIVRKNAEPPVSREEFERRKKVWKAHEKIVLEPFLEAASDLVDAVEKYTRQECLRSELMIKKDKLKELINGR